MRNAILYILKSVVFWLAFFAFTRMVFLAYNYKHLDGNDLLPVMESFWFALPLDISTASYLLSLSLILMLLFLLFPNKTWLKANRIYVFLLVVIISVLCAAELLLYHEWGSKIHYKIFVHLQHPDEVLRTASYYHYFVFIGGLLFYVLPAVFFYNRFIHSSVKLPHHGKEVFRVDYVFLFGFAGIGLLILGARGGLREIPVNQSVVYFSNKNLINAATVNTPWNLVHSVIENRKSFSTNPFTYYNLEEAKKRTEHIHAVAKDTTVSILTTDRPNIVIFLLESWTAHVIKSLGADVDVTPNFDTLASQGVLFTNIYRSGWTSDFGNASVLSGYPALAIACIVSQENKYSKISCLNRMLEPLGYSSSYYFGGELNYGNIKSYIVYQGFDRVIEQKDFPSDMPSGSLGIPDEYVYRRHLHDYRQAKAPFFTTIFNLSSHSPWDMPVRKIIHFADNDNMHLNGMHYTDRCLTEYMKEAKKSPWYDSTLFIFIADHGHHSHKNLDVGSAEHARIPMLFYGNVIKPEFRGTRIEKTGSQMDFAATLLKQLNLDTKDFPWSKNLLNPYTPEFAQFVFPAGFGWVTPQGFFSYNYIAKQYHLKNISVPGAEDSIIKDGKCYMETVFQQYLEY